MSLEPLQCLAVLPSVTLTLQTLQLDRTTAPSIYDKSIFRHMLFFSNNA